MQPEQERKLAIGLFNHVWAVMEKPDRSRQEDDEMIHAAHACAYHLGGRRQARESGERRMAGLSRLHAARPGRGGDGARTAMPGDLPGEQSGRLDLAYAYEAVARANKVAGRAAEAERNRMLARLAGDRIEELDDREHFDKDYATL